VILIWKCMQLNIPRGYNGPCPPSPRVPLILHLLSYSRLAIIYYNIIYHKQFLFISYYELWIINYCSFKQIVYRIPVDICTLLSVDCCIPYNWGFNNSLYGKIIDLMIYYSFERDIDHKNNRRLQILFIFSCMN